jgi:hypothetical protein
MWNKDKQNLQCYLTKRKYHTREPRIHQENTKEHQEILQSFTLLLQERLPNGTKNHKRKWERMRESGERFWHNRVVVKNSCQNEERGLPFKGGREERPLLDELQVSPIQERENKSRRAHF